MNSKAQILGEFHAWDIFEIILRCLTFITDLMWTLFNSSSFSHENNLRSMKTPIVLREIPLVVAFEILKRYHLCVFFLSCGWLCALHTLIRLLPRHGRCIFTNFSSQNRWLPLRRMRPQRLDHIATQLRDIFLSVWESSLSSGVN